MSATSASRRWLAVILGLLLFSVVTQAVLIGFALSDPSFALEPDYERKAADYDQELEQERDNRRLGWTIEIEAAGPAPAEGATRFVVSLADAGGAPIPEATITVEGFAVVRAAERYTAQVVTDAEGRAGFLLRLVRGGRHELRFVADRGAERFTAVRQRQLERVARIAPLGGARFAEPR